jgi:methylmalonyl-CoA mutase
VLTGTSDFPNLAEVSVNVLDVTPAASATPAAAIKFPPLPRIRLAEPFERLRDASDRMLASTGKRPAVFLANLGTAAEFTPRATFAKNFFETGGIEAIANEGFEDRNRMVSAFKASRARLACLCSSDAVYDRQAADAAKALVAAGAFVVLAGRPGEQEKSWRDAGVEDFIHASGDALAALRKAHDRLAG